MRAYGVLVLLASTSIAFLAKAEEPKAPVVAPEADRLVRDMGDYLKAAPQLSFHAEITYDDLLPTGQKLQLGATYQAAVRRPDRVFTEYVGDADARRLWFDGKTVTLYDPALDVYATEPAQGTIDSMVDHLTKQVGFAPPLSDFMTSDPAATLRKNALYGFVVGPSEIDGVNCQHLAFVQQDIDWQIWIEDGTRVLPRKLLITYKRLPGAPQFTAVLSDWDLATRPPDSLFVAQPPASASRIEFLTAANAKPKPAAPKPAAPKKSAEGTK
jgi:hypothetical protein